jgi:hypothetical protein
MGSFNQTVLQEPKAEDRTKPLISVAVYSFKKGSTVADWLTTLCFYNGGYLLMQPFFLFHFRSFVTLS